MSHFEVATCVFQLKINLISPWEVTTCVFQDGVIDKPANHVDQGGVDCAENIVRIRGEVDHLNCHLLMIKGNILIGY